MRWGAQEMVLGTTEPIKRVSFGLAAISLLVVLPSCGSDDEPTATPELEVTTTTTPLPLPTTPATRVRHDYPPLTPTSTFGEIAAHPAFAGFGPYMDLQEAGEGVEPTRQLSVEVLTQVREEWDQDTILGGLNFMIDQVSAGATIWYPLYTDEEIAEDPTKASAGMFFVAGDPGRPLALVAPGGGLAAVVSIQEGFPHAVALHERGFNVAILKYRIEPDGPRDIDLALERAVEDQARALALVEQNADVWGVDLDGYSLWGSSAGGAVVSAWGTDGPLGAEAHGFEPPAAIIGAYPAPWFEPASSFPPYFVIMAADDTAIPVAQIDALVDDLEAEGVEVEYQRLESGGHGFGTGVGTPAEGWLDDAVAFWDGHLDVD